MIVGIGTDIAKVSRFERWTKDPSMICRFFNTNEMNTAKSMQASCEHYAARFAAKEAFVKALGIGLAGFSLRDVYITNDQNGKPALNVCGSAQKILKSMYGDCYVHVSLTHEKEYAVAFVIIEKKD